MQDYEEDYDTCSEQEEDIISEYDEVSEEEDFIEEIYEEEPMEEEYRLTLEDKIARELMEEAERDALFSDRSLDPKPKMRHVPTEQEMDEAYADFCAILKKEKEEVMKIKAKELSEWASSIGVCVADIPGSFEDQYNEMKEQKKIALIKATDKIRLEKEKQKEVERQATLEILNKNAQSVSSHNHIAGKERAKKSAGACNAKGKLQGDKNGKSKRVRRAEAKKAEEEAQARRRVASNPQPLIAGNQIVPQIDLGIEEESEEEVEEINFEIKVPKKEEVVTEPKNNIVFTTKTEPKDDTESSDEEAEPKDDTESDEEWTVYTGKKKVQVPSVPPPKIIKIAPYNGMTLRVKRSSAKEEIRNLISRGITVFSVEVL